MLRSNAIIQISIHEFLPPLLWRRRSKRSFDKRERNTGTTSRHWLARRVWRCSERSNLGWLKTALIAHGLDSFYSYSMAIQFSAIVRDPCPLDQVVGRTRNVVIWAQHHPDPLYGAGVMGAQSDVHQKKIRNWRSERICHAKTILRLWSGDSVFMLFATGRRLFSIIVLVCLVWRRLYGKHMADGGMYVS